MQSCPGNPVLTNLHDASRQVQCSGHGDLFQDHLGNWWLVHLATRISRRTMSHLGRETFLTPVTWEEDWPVVGNNRKASLICEGPLWAEQEAEKLAGGFFKQEMGTGMDFSAQAGRGGL